MAYVMKLIKIKIWIYGRAVREVHNYMFKEVEEFVKRIAGSLPHVVDVVEVSGDVASIRIEVGRHGIIIEAVIPKEKLDMLGRLAEAVKKALSGDDADFIRAVSELYNMMYDMLTVDENYVDVEIKVEHSESEGMRAVAFLRETFG